MYYAITRNSSKVRNNHIGKSNPPGKVSVDDHCIV